MLVPDVIAIYMLIRCAMSYSFVCKTENTLCGRLNMPRPCNNIEMIFCSLIETSRYNACEMMFRPVV